MSWSAIFSRRRPFRALCVLLLCAAIRPVSVMAQEMKVTGGFLSDSVKIGEETGFYLTAKYRSNLSVLFPDSTFAFAPFEYQGRRYFPTATADSVSTDSAVYYLSTFEVDRVQRLGLPVFIVQERDCTDYRSPMDSILITQLVAKVPDSVSVDKLPLKMNTAYEKVFFQFNFWLLIIGGAVLLLAAGLTWYFYGDKIRRHFAARRIQKRHAKFLSNYDAMLRQLQQSSSTPTTESALAMWKHYMEQLESKPFSKLTTRETAMLLRDESLKTNLQAIDASIYGHASAVISSLDFLRGYADQRFTKKLQEVRHGE